MDALEAQYRELRREIRALGFHERRYGYYALYASVACAATLLSLYLITVTDSAWFQALNAALFTISIVQASMLGHDLSHNQVFESERTNRFLSAIVWGLFGGGSESSWYRDHNAHHKETNRLGHDPDLGIPFLFSNKQSSDNHWMSRTFLSYQHIIFFATLPAWYLNKIVTTWKHAFTHPSLRVTFFELPFAAVHFLVLFYLLFTFLPWTTAVLFLVVHAVTAGFYLSAAFAPNHKGMEIIDADQKATWRNQIRSTRNLYPSWFVFYMMGGLNFQIEHHLFPNMPRINYPLVQPIIKRFCKDNDIPYHETTWFGSQQEMYHALKEQAYKFRATRTNAA
jgi:fatty acid desaturase